MEMIFAKPRQRTATAELGEFGGRCSLLERIRFIVGTFMDESVLRYHRVMFRPRKRFNALNSYLKTKGAGTVPVVIENMQLEFRN